MCFIMKLKGLQSRLQQRKLPMRGERLENVMIYDHTQHNGNRKVIVADYGLMATSEDNSDLILTLFNGFSYDEQQDKNRKNRIYPLFRNSFDKDIIRMDISQFELNRTDEELFKTHYEMLNLVQLNQAIDSFYIRNDERKGMLFSSMKNNYSLLSDTMNLQSNLDSSFSVYRYLDEADSKKVSRIYQNAANITRGLKNRVNTAKMEIDDRHSTIRKHYVEWHKKLTLSFACIVLFFIGAPLGAIIRKGGLGMPVVVSVIFFLVFHVLSITGEKLSEENVLMPVFGMWLASLVLLPVGVFLTYQATTDSTVLDLSTYTNFFKKLMKSKNK